MATANTSTPNGITVSGTGDALTVTCRGVSATFTAAQLFTLLMNNQELFPFTVG